MLKKIILINLNGARANFVANVLTVLAIAN